MPASGAGQLSGLVRDMNDGASVAEMTLEHYPGMTEKALEAIVAEAKGAGISTTRWSSTALARSSRATRSCWSP
jgi:molybdopterin synthase catalytic subunit